MLERLLEDPRPRFEVISILCTNSLSIILALYLSVINHLSNNRTSSTSRWKQLLLVFSFPNNFMCVVVVLLMHFSIHISTENRVRPPRL